MLPISVVVPAYNRADMVRRAVESALAQRPRPPAEVIVVDDGSSDDTADMAEDAGARVIRHSENMGECAARNTAIEAASQPWIALLDSDDEWLPHLLATLWPARDDHVLVAGSALHLVGDPAHDRFAGPAGREPTVLRSPAALMYPENFVPASGVMLRADVVKEVGAYNVALLQAPDLDLWLRVLERGTGVVVPSVVMLYHLHPGQVTHDPRALTDGHLRVVHAYADRPWWSRARVEGWHAGMAWHDLRRNLRTGSRVEALRSAAWIARHPVRLGGLVPILVRRYRLRRRGAAVTPTGLPSVTVLARRGGLQEFEALGVSDGGGPSRSARRARIVLRLARRPAGIALVDSPLQAALVSALGVRPLRVDRPGWEAQLRSLRTLAQG